MVKDGLCYKHFKAQHGRAPYICREKGCTRSVFKEGRCSKHIHQANSQEQPLPAPAAEPKAAAATRALIANRNEYIHALRNRKAELLEELSMINTSLSVVETFTR